MLTMVRRQSSAGATARDHGERSETSPEILTKKQAAKLMEISLPLDGPRRFARHIIGHPVDALDLVDDDGFLQRKRKNPRHSAILSAKKRRQTTGNHTQNHTQ
jgi:hypothetical protein